MLNLLPDRIVVHTRKFLSDNYNPDCILALGTNMSLFSTSASGFYF